MATTYSSSNPNEYVYSDLNARLPKVANRDSMVITDREAILQSIYRLLETQEGEIPYYREYGLNLKQFVQAPLNDSLANTIESYVSGKIEKYEARVTVYKKSTQINYNNSSVILQYYLKIKSTEEIIQLQPVTVWV